MKKVQKTTNNKSILHKLSCVMTVFMLIQIIAVYSPVMAEESKTTVFIRGTKEVTGDNVPSGQTFTFELTRVVDINGDTYTGSGEINKTTTVTTTNHGYTEYLFTFQLDLADGVYCFKIEEIPGSSQGWDYDDKSYIIEVTVGDGKYMIIDMDTTEKIPSDEDDLTWVRPSVIVPGGDPNLPWGSANYFSVLTFGDFYASGSDVEGGLAVGGDHNIGGGGYSVGKTGLEYEAGYPIAPHNPRLLVKGKLSAQGTLIAWGGSIVVSNSSDVTGVDKVWTRKYIGTLPFYAPNTAETNFADPVKSLTRGPDDTVSNFFSNAYEDMKTLSAYYAGLTDGNRIKVVDVVATTNKHPAYVYNGTSITTIFFDESTEMGGNPGAKGAFPLLPGEYGEYDTIVYNLILNDFTGSVAQISSSQFTIPEEYKGNIIINVIPGSNITTLNILGGDMYINRVGTEGNGKLRENARKYSDRIIWNFPSTNLTKITISSQEIIGSVLAPYADFTPTGGGVNGTLVAKSVTVAGGGWETHTTTYFGRVQVNTNKIEFTNTYGTIPTPGDNSITVHKYIVDSLESYTTPGDGQYISGTGHPNDLEKLDGITFTLYSFTSPPTGSFPEYKDIKVIDSKLNLYDSNMEVITTYPLTYIRKEITGGGGVAKFSNLEDGYYVVVEEPDSRVIEPIVPFIVQLPLYSKDVSGLKDVHVYPKNQGKPGGDKFPDTGGIGSVIFTVTGIVMLSGSLVALTLADKKSKSARAKK